MKKEFIIEIKDVWKKYDMGEAGSLVVLKEINLEIEKGDFIAITGPSGSGKSTMVNIVGALDKPSWGKLYLKGKEVSKMDESALAFLRGKTIGFIFQRFNLIPTLTAIQNVMLPAEISEMSEFLARQKARELLKLLGLEDRMEHTPGELSGGQQQRVAIARALANDPEIIIADEPTGNLDSKTGKFVMDFLGKMNQLGKTVVLITHDLNLVHYAKRIIYLKDGKIEKEVHNGRRLSQDIFEKELKNKGN